MNTQFHPVVLEARFGQLASALRSGAARSRSSLGAVGTQARAALRGLDASAPQHERARLGRSASRLARQLANPSGEAAAHAGGVALEQSILRLGIEMGRRLDPMMVAATVRNVLNGSAELSITDTGTGTEAAKDEPADALATLFTQIALVAALARAHTA